MLNYVSWAFESIVESLFVYELCEYPYAVSIILYDIMRKIHWKWLDDLLYKKPHWIPNCISSLFEFDS